MEKLSIPSWQIHNRQSRLVGEMLNWYASTISLARRREVDRLPMLEVVLAQAVSYRTSRASLAPEKDLSTTVLYVCNSCSDLPFPNLSNKLS